MEWFASIFHFFFDKERSIPKKASMAIIIAALIYFVDDAVGFTYYYNTDKKIAEVNAINNVIKDATTDSITRAEFISLRNKIACRRSIKVMAEDLAVSIIHPKRNIIKHHTKIQRGDSSGKVDDQDKLTKYKRESKSKPTRNNILFMLSTSGISLFFSLIVVIAAFFIKENSVLMKIGTAFAFAVLAFLWSLFWYWLGGIINEAFNAPINNNWNCNYLINFLVQLMLYYIPIKIATNRNKKKLQPRIQH